MSNSMPLIGWLEADGTGHALGHALGRRGREAVHRLLVPSLVWRAVVSKTGDQTLHKMARMTKERFPAIWSEIEGLAEGLDLPLADVFAWNCRGDLFAAVPDGCTTVQLPGVRPVVAHNEDGLPFFRGHCFMARAGAAGFTAFCYPGSLPGHTFAVTEEGLVQTVNNLRLIGIRPEIPRMVLGRAVLAAGELGPALALLREAAPSGGFHFTLAEKGRSAITSVEIGGGTVSVRGVNVPSLHANHALHLETGLTAQTITQSSADRQRRGEALLASGVRDPLAILHDTGGTGLPILRQAADDPDDENTLATAFFEIGSERIAWRVYERPGGKPLYANEFESA